MEMAFELGLKGCDTLKRKEEYFLAENIMNEGKGMGECNPIQQSVKRYFSIV